MGESISLHSLYLRTPITKESTEVDLEAVVQTKAKGQAGFIREHLQREKQ